MSRVGFNKILVPNGVDIHFDAGVISVKGPKGDLSMSVNPEISVLIENNQISFSRSLNDRFTRSLHGTIQSKINNMVIGVSRGHEKILELKGVGYRVALDGKVLVLSLGYSHPVRYSLPVGIEASIDKQTTLTLRGTDKQVVGQIAAEIRSFRPPEPYKGKGVKYQSEVIRRKEGKKGK